MKSILNSSIENIIAIFTAFGILIHLLIFFLTPFQSYSYIPLYLITFIGGGILTIDLLKKTFQLEFGSDLLAGISIVTSILLGEYLAGSLVVLMLSGGQAIERFAIKKASKMLEVLANRAPTVAHIKKNDITDVAVASVQIGEEVVIFPHEICPIDGVVIEGNGVMDESYLTGEPFLISKAPGSMVISGAINGDSTLNIKATKLAQDSRYAKIMQVMSESEQKKPKMRRLADQLGAWYTPLALIIAFLAWIISGESIRFLAVLVIATPCPLLIAIPVSIIGSISLCAKQGILIKNPIALEQVNDCETMIFDKTGTLTYGKPVLSEQKIYGDRDAKEILQLAATLERYSKHPLANAILDKAKEEDIKLLIANEISEPKGAGLVGRVENKTVEITSRKKLKTRKEEIPVLSTGSGLECFILIDDKLQAHYLFRDAPRMESKQFVKHLSPKHHIKKLMIVSGDREEEVSYLAKEIGIQDIYASKSPEEKVEIVLKEREKAKTIYLGDGINDAPALVAANVGIAFGTNSDITSEAASAVIMESSLEKVDEFLHISKRMKKIALQSALGGMFFSLIGMFAAAFGFLPPVAGAILQEIIDIVAILNSLRTIWPPKLISDME